MYREETVTVDIGGRALKFSTGKVAKQAHGATWVRYGDSVVLVTAAMDKNGREGLDFLPFTVDYREYTYAGGRIPGGFFKREGKPTDPEVLISRMIDRPLRPLFPEGFHYETQVIAMVLSADYENDPGIMAINGASFSLYCSVIPFTRPIGAVRVGLMDGQYVVNPSMKVMDQSRLNLVVAGTKEAICMVEAGASELSESEMVEALKIAHAEIRKIVEAQEELFARLGIQKMAVERPVVDPAHLAEVEERIAVPLRQAMAVKGKLAMYAALDKVRDDLLATYPEDQPERKAEAGRIYHEVLVKTFRSVLLREGRRVDGRLFDEIRPVWSEVGVLPRTHGSALFTRGETMALANCTLGTAADAQRLSGLLEGQQKHFILHYNFPPFSVGEVKFLRGPGRREIGHGALAERAIAPMIPDEKAFPYTIRVVSDILESNGSSSQATICGATLALMDAGVPIKAPVAGVAMGLIMEGDRYAILSDIAGLEDHYGDMDFKVAGTSKGITALQMDIKVDGISFEIMTEALQQARKGRLHLLELMAQTLPAPRPDISPYAPRIYAIQIPKAKIGELIGPGGKNVRAIQESTGVDINIEEDGTVQVASSDAAAAEKALAMIRAQMEEPELGRIYKGVVKRVEPYGAFVEILPGTDGLLHVSELDWNRVDSVDDVLKLGDEIEVKLVDYERGGKLRLSRKVLLPKPEGYMERPRAPRDDRPPRSGPRGDRRDDRRGDRDRGGDRGRPSRPR
jgi:polyribonucleotide nucleotidyltransferase